MVLSELELHDSNLISIKENGDSVELSVDLCNWKQTWYQEGDDELREIKIIFFGVSEMKWDADISMDELDYYTIIDFKSSVNEVKLVASEETTVVCEFKYSKCDIELL